MSDIVIGFSGLGISLLLIAMRVHIGVALGSISLLGIGLILNSKAAWGMITATPFNFIGNWTFTAVPMFLLMGFMCTSTGLTKGLFHATQVFFTRLPGGLAIASVGASALFASACGSSVATASAMSRIAVPEMLRYKYDKGLATATVAASGTLGSLIPPSIVMILYALYADTSVGKLFMAGFIPGILSALIYISMIVTRVKLKPELAASIDITYSKEEKIKAAKDIWPLPVLILMVLGGIFFGVFTPTEAGAIGATLSMIIAFFRKSLTLESVKKSLGQTVRGTASIFIIIIGTSFLARFMALSGVPQFLSEGFLSFGAGPYYMIFGVALLYLFLGMFVEPIGLLLLTLPIILPLANSLGVDLIWFGIIIVKLLEIALITPPVGLNVYVIKGALGELVSLNTIFKGVYWFILMDVITLLLLVIFPEITLFLPNLMWK